MIETVDLRRLHVLRMLDEHGTVTAAAEALHLTPSAVSHQLRQLAREVGTDLVEPHGRTVRLTSAARLLVGHADALHARWEQARADLDTQGDDGAGHLSISAFPSAVSGFLAPAVALLRRTYPGLTAQITELETSPEGYAAVLTGQVDLAIVAPTSETPPVTSPRFDQQPLFEQPFDLVVPVGHRLTERRTVELADAASEPWVLSAPGSCDSNDIIMAACAAAGFRPDVVHEAREWGSIAALVAAGLGVSLIPRFGGRPMPRGAVRVRLRGNPKPVRHLLTCVRAGSADQPAITHGLWALRRVVANQVAHSKH